MRIAMLGGTGPEGLGIAVRLCAVGESVIIGSRSAERATEAVRKVGAKVSGGLLSGGTNPEAAAKAEVIFVVVPYEGVERILADCAPSLAGKVVVDAVIPLQLVDGVFRTQEIAEGSAGERIQARVPQARVVSAFKHQSAHDLVKIEKRLEGDVLICGNDEGAKALVFDLVRRMPDLRPIDAGDLRAARMLDSITALLLNLNKKHKARTSIRILGLRP